MDAPTTTEAGVGVAAAAAPAEGGAALTEATADEGPAPKLIAYSDGVSECCTPPTAAVRLTASGGPGDVRIDATTGATTGATKPFERTATAAA